MWAAGGQFEATSDLKKGVLRKLEKQREGLHWGDERKGRPVSWKMLLCQFGKRKQRPKTPDLRGGKGGKLGKRDLGYDRWRGGNPWGENRPEKKLRVGGTAKRHRKKGEEIGRKQVIDFGGGEKTIKDNGSSSHTMKKKEKTENKRVW